jgi:dsRNA-specific ribonuclease
MAGLDSSTAHVAERGPAFKKFVISLLVVYGGMTAEEAKILTKKAISFYDMAFTHSSVNPTENYEIWEGIGDSVANAGIVDIVARRMMTKFPELRSPVGLKILCRLKINLISKESYYTLGMRMGLLEYISSDAEIRSKLVKGLVEDVFEAFIGVTSIVADSTFGLGKGREVCYTVIKTLLEPLEIPISYDDLFDAKTRLKELFDRHAKELGTIRYVCRRIEIGEVPKDLLTDNNRQWESLHYSEVYRCKGGSSYLLGRGVEKLKIHAQMNASEQALVLLKEEGFVKELSSIYEPYMGKFI